MNEQHDPNAADSQIAKRSELEDAGEAAPGADPSSSSGPRWKMCLALWSVFLGSLVVGLFFQAEIGGYLVGLIPPPSPRGKVLYWTSPHDATFRADQPGKDSMGMDLVPVYANAETPKGPVTIDPTLRERNYSTTTVEKGPLVRTVRTVSTVAYAEPLIGDVTLKVDAWLDKIHVNYEGQTVKKGDAIAEVYSPKVVASQEEFLIGIKALEAARKQPSQNNRQLAEENVETTRQRLRYWDVSDKQIESLAKSGTVHKTLTYYSRFAGVVIEKKAFEGSFMPAGHLLYRIADLSKVWVYAYVYQDQIHCVYYGQGATLTLPNLSGRKFVGKVIYIYPYLEPKIRAVKVRLEFDNANLALKPNMFTQVEFEPHHMGMGLKIPSKTVLDTGMRKLVYVALPDGRFDPREVTIGRNLDGDVVEVLAGLREGEQVVTSEEFLLDSESRLRLINRAFEPYSMPMMKQDMKPMDGMKNQPKMPMKMAPGMKHDKHK